MSEMIISVPKKSLLADTFKKIAHIAQDLRICTLCGFDEFVFF